MKKTNYFKLFALALICCLSTTISAQTNADSTTFSATFSSLQTNGGGTINLTTDIPIRLVKNQTYALESDALNPIQINTNQFKIISIGDNITADSTILKIGNNVSILGNSTVLTNLNRGIIRINGGLIKSTTSLSGTSAVVANAGWIYVSGGTISVEVTAPVVNAYALSVLNSFSLVLRGGTISAIGDNTRALSLTDGVTNIANIVKPFSGGTITANGNGAYGIQSLGVNSLSIGDNTTITTTSLNGSDAALVGGGSSSIIVIPSTSQNVTITSSIPYKLDNAASAVIDMRGLSLVASPVSGSSLTYPGNNVTISATGNTSAATAGIYYSYVVNPTITSPNIASGGSVAASSASTTINAAIGKNGFIDSNILTANYTVTGLPSGLPINVSTFADLQAAYTTSLSASDTTRIKLLAAITVNAAFTMTPDAAHPIAIDANGFQINIGVAASTFSTTFGGSLIIKSYVAPTNGMFRIYGATTTNITGGSYIMNASKPIIDLETGSSISDTGTQINLSNATFIVNGTTNASSIIKTVTSNGYLFSATNCIFTVNPKAVAFSFNGTKIININNCTLNMLGTDATSQPFYQAPSSTVAGYSSTLTINGLQLNMNAATGNVFNWSGSKAINTVIKDLSLNGSGVIAKPSGATGTVKFYDFRAFTPTVSIAPGNYTSDQSVALTLSTTAILPVDAGAATFVYTLDGTDPLITSLTASPVTITTPTTIKMAAKSADGLFLGKTYSFAYTFTTTGVANVDSNAGISLSPTVVENTVTVNQKAKQILVLDLAGKLMMQKSNATQFDMSGLKAGVYLVKVNATDNTTKTIKVVKL